MGRLIAVVTAFTLLAVATPAAAAEVTRVASSGEPNNPFDLDLSVRWERSSRTAVIARERTTAPAGGQPFAVVEELQQLKYQQISNLLVGRVAVGLWEDLQLQAELPYYLSQETSWKRAADVGIGLPDTIQDEALHPDGSSCGGLPCPIFPTSPGPTVFHGGVTGDLQVGLTWGIFSDKRDDTKPAWNVGVDVTFPTAKLYDPAAGRGAGWTSPYFVSSKAGPVGQKVWRYDLFTALSRRMGPVDPYFRTHVTFLRKSSGTYSNCDQAAVLLAAGQMGAGAAASCAANPDAWGARLPYQAGMTFGAELVPYEDAAAGQKIAFDVRLDVQYDSAGRWYNELTDATGKLLWTEAHVTASGRVGLLFRASELVSVQGHATLGWVSPHYLSGEALGSAAENPNFDWRYDAPGRRFRSTQGMVLDLQVSGVLQF